MGNDPTCQSCQYLSFVLQRQAACERHTRPPARPPRGDAERRAARGGLAPATDAVFSVGELARLEQLRAILKPIIARGGHPDELPARAWREG